MSAYLITYDLNKTGQKYDNLIEAIKAFGNWCHPTESTWIVISESTTAAVRDYLMQKIDSNDELLVVKLQGDWGSAGLSKQVNDWLKANL